MTDTQFLMASLTTAYTLGWVFGSTLLYFRKLMEASI